jgi:hypothetical protein
MLAQMGKQMSSLTASASRMPNRDFAVMVSPDMNKKHAALGSVGQPAMALCGGDAMLPRAQKKLTNGYDLGFVGEIFWSIALD